ncbi:hypothetical protein K439DRAFT_1622318 [Ramaria rubella]|nr:hypothetical protein K439DRAFT_1622318 [Ramaria rubella]
MTNAANSSPIRGGIGIGLFLGTASSLASGGRGGFLLGWLSVYGRNEALEHRLVALGSSLAMTPRSPALTLCNFGMWRATFRCHVEDMDLSRPVNYIHFRNRCSQALKTTIKAHLLTPPPSPTDNAPCLQLLHHTFFLAFPNLLSQSSRHPPAWLPRRNLGFNCTENVTLALKSWNEVGLRAAFCVCGADSVRVDVRGLIDAWEREKKAEAEALEDFGAESSPEAECRSGD